MKEYKAIIFDLFDTLINFNRSRLPEVELDGTPVRSTSRAAYKVFRRFYKYVDFRSFYDAFMESYVELNRIKDEEHRELHNRERFKLMLSKMDIPIDPWSDELIEDMVSVHMDGIANAMEFPEENRETLDIIREKNARLAIISNFDHAPTAYGLLDKFDIKSYFERILISVEIGWRKPRADIFLEAFDLLRINPQDAIFVGDSYEADVIGSKGVGMNVIWINKNDEPIKDEGLKPDYVVSSFSEIKKYINRRA
jgi:putative hydrolase of the HAD superfamily